MSQEILKFNGKLFISIKALENILTERVDRINEIDANEWQRQQLYAFKWMLNALRLRKVNNYNNLLKDHKNG